MTRKRPAKSRHTGTLSAPEAAAPVSAAPPISAGVEAPRRADDSPSPARRRGPSLWEYWMAAGAVVLGIAVIFFIRHLAEPDLFWETARRTASAEDATPFTVLGSPAKARRHNNEPIASTSVRAERSLSHRVEQAEYSAHVDARAQEIARWKEAKSQHIEDLRRDLDRYVFEAPRDEAGHREVALKPLGTGQDSLFYGPHDL